MNQFSAKNRISTTISGHMRGEVFLEFIKIGNKTEEMFQSINSFSIFV